MRNGICAVVMLLSVCRLAIAVGGGEGAADPADNTDVVKEVVLSDEESKGTENTMIKIKTNMGDMTVELFDNDAPLTVANFLSYLDDGHYDGTIFHRVIGNFMIQGGGFDKQFKQKATKAPVKNEADNGLKNDRGTLAMARTGVIDSATCQFFINVNDNASLNHTANNQRGFGYCVFGKVVEGMDVVDAIKGVPTGFKNGHRDVPQDTVEIIEISRID